MKKLCYLIALLLFFTGFYSCSEDEGNYDYDWISDVSVLSFNLQANTYQKGDPLVIRPNVSFAKNGEEETAVEDVFSEDEYDFYWIAQRYVESLERIVYDTIGRERNLNYIINLDPAKYLVEYQICNKSREIKWLSRFDLIVTLSAPEGWLFLEDDNGQAELSIYARLGDGSMHMVRNVLANSGIPAASLAGPRQVFSTYQTQKGNGVWILTDHFTGYLNVKNGHKWETRQVVQNHIVESVGNDFVFNKMIGVMFHTVLGFSDDGLRMSHYPGMLYTGDLLPTPENGRFEVAPYACVVGYEMSSKQILLFDNTNKCFKLLNYENNYSWTKTDAQFPEGYDLMFMQTVDYSPEKICCLLKKEGNVYEMTASDAATVEKGAEVISSSEKFLNAKQITYHMFLHFPYYYYDNTLYVNRGRELGDQEVEIWRAPEKEEEPEQGQTQIKAELEGQITYIKTQTFSDLYGAGNEYRRDFMNYLIVATEMPDGTGKVYFLTPEEANAYKLTISGVVSTDHKVVSIDYQRPNILDY